MVGILVPIAFFGTLFGILYVFFITRNRERMAMIEKGVDASYLNSQKAGTGALKFGMLFVGVALGILMGHLLNTLAHLREEVSFISMISFFGGLALIIFHLVEKKTSKIG